MNSLTAHIKTENETTHHVAVQREILLNEFDEIASIEWRVFFDNDLILVSCGERRALDVARALIVGI